MLKVSELPSDGVYLTVAECAAKAGVTVGRIYQLISHGELRAVRRRGLPLLISDKDFRLYLMARLPRGRQPRSGK